jgi:hypothetical protein
VTGRQRRRRKQVFNYLKQMILETEIERLWKILFGRGYGRVVRHRPTAELMNGVNV